MDKIEGIEGYYIFKAIPCISQDMYFWVYIP